LLPQLAKANALLITLFNCQWSLPVQKPDKKRQLFFCLLVSTLWSWWA